MGRARQPPLHQPSSHRVGEIVSVSYEASHPLLGQARQGVKVNAIDDSKVEAHPEIVSALESLETEAQLSSNEMSDIKGPVKKLLMADELRVAGVSWQSTRRASLSMRCALCVAYVSRVLAESCRGGPVIAVGPFGLHR